MRKAIISETYRLIEEEMAAVAPLTDEEDVAGLRCLLLILSDVLKRNHFGDRFKLAILVHLLRKLPTAMADRFQASLEAEEEGLPNKKALLLLRHYLGNHLVDLYVRPAEARRRLVLTPEERRRLLAIVQAEVTPLQSVENRRHVEALQPLLAVLAHARLLVRPYGPVEGAALEAALFDAVWAKLPEEVRRLHATSAVKLAAYGHKSLAPLNRTLTALIREARLEEGAQTQERLLRELVGRRRELQQQQQLHFCDDFSTIPLASVSLKNTEHLCCRCSPSSPSSSSSSSSTFSPPTFSTAVSSSPLPNRSQVALSPITTNTPSISSPSYSTAPPLSSSDESNYSSSWPPLPSSSSASSPHSSSSSSFCWPLYSPSDSSPSHSPITVRPSGFSELLSGGPLRYRYCAYCKTLGHHTFDCALPKTMLCFNCFEVGHKAKYCTVQQFRVGNPYFEGALPVDATTTTSTTTNNSNRLPMSQLLLSTPRSSLSPTSTAPPPRLVQLPDGQLFGPRSAADLNLCLECVQFGHRAATCSRALCFNCHLTGHMSSHCPAATVVTAATATAVQKKRDPN